MQQLCFGVWTSGGCAGRGMLPGVATCLAPSPWRLLCSIRLAPRVQGRPPEDAVLQPGGALAAVLIAAAALPGRPSLLHPSSRHSLRPSPHLCPACWKTAPFHSPAHHFSAPWGVTNALCRPTHRHRRGRAPTTTLHVRSVSEREAPASFSHFGLFPTDILIREHSGPVWGF